MFSHTIASHILISFWLGIEGLARGRKRLWASLNPSCIAVITSTFKDYIVFSKLQLIKCLPHILHLIMLFFWMYPSFKVLAVFTNSWKSYARSCPFMPPSLEKKPHMSCCSSSQALQLGMGTCPWNDKLKELQNDTIAGYPNNIVDLQEIWPPPIFGKLTSTPWSPLCKHSLQIQKKWMNLPHNTSPHASN
jgi:hypothetical protein